MFWRNENRYERREVSVIEKKRWGSGSTLITLETPDGKIRYQRFGISYKELVELRSKFLEYDMQLSNWPPPKFVLD